MIYIEPGKPDKRASQNNAAIRACLNFTFVSGRKKIYSPVNIIHENEGDKPYSRELHDRASSETKSSIRFEYGNEQGKPGNNQNQ